ncbi:MAG TPA: NrsF family protein [Vicinamibacterales bacterium]
MKTDLLIVELARDLRPVRPLSSPLLRLSRWLAAVIAVAALGIWLLGPRADLASAIANAVYDARFVLTVAAGIFAGAAAFVLSVPAAESYRAQRFVPFVFAIAWALLLGVLLASGGRGMERLLAFPVNWPCGYKILAFSVIFGIALLIALRRAAPLELTWTAALAALSSTALAAAATQLICPVDDAAHQIVGHVAPVAVLGFLGTVIGFRTLRWPGSPRR